MLFKYQNKVFKKVVAIDPDSEKSGVATLIAQSNDLIYESLKFSNLLEYLQTLAREEMETTLVVIEAGYLNQKANWHDHTNSRISSRVGENTGRNHQTARLLVEMAGFYKLNTVEARPLKKCWKGTDGKISTEELNGLLLGAGFKPIKRTNQDTRDAILLGLVYSGTRLISK